MDDRVSGLISRRSFLTGALTLSGSLATAGLAAPILRYAYPNVPETPAARILVPGAEELQPLADTVDFEYQESPCSLLRVDDGTYSGVSRICTHLGCIVSWRNEEGDFYCPCHAGIFSPTGEVLAGPPPRPLPRLSLELQDSQVWVVGWHEA